MSYLALLLFLIFIKLLNLPVDLSSGLFNIGWHRWYEILELIVAVWVFANPALQASTLGLAELFCPRANNLAWSRRKEFLGLSGIRFFLKLSWCQFFWIESCWPTLSLSCLLLNYLLLFFRRQLRYYLGVFYYGTISFHLPRFHMHLVVVGVKKSVVQFWISDYSSYGMCSLSMRRGSTQALFVAGHSIPSFQFKVSWKSQAWMRYVNMVSRIVLLCGQSIGQVPEGRRPAGSGWFLVPSLFSSRGELGDVQFL